MSVPAVAELLEDDPRAQADSGSLIPRRWSRAAACPLAAAACCSCAAPAAPPHLVLPRAAIDQALVVEHAGDLVSASLRLLHLLVGDVGRGRPSPAGRGASGTTESSFRRSARGSGSDAATGNRHRPALPSAVERPSRERAAPLAPSARESRAAASSKISIQVDQERFLFSGFYVGPRHDEEGDRSASRLGLGRYTTAGPVGTALLSARCSCRSSDACPGCASSRN